MTLPYQSIVCLAAGAIVILALVQPLSSRPATVAWIGVLAAVGCGALGFVYASGIPQLVTYAVGGFLLVAVGLAPALELEIKEQRPEVVALLLLAGAGAIGLAAGGDLLQLTVSMETLSLSAALLVVLGRGPVLTEAAFKYFLLAAVSMASLLYGLGLVYLSTGSFAFPALSAHPSALLVGGLVLMTAGFAFELALVPLHWGALDIYTSGPPAVAGAIMALSKLGAVVAIIRLAPAAGAHYLFVLAMVGLLSAVWATACALLQREVRRLLAYSAVAHAGLLAMGIGSGVAGRQAAIFYVIAYGATALLVFSALAGLGPEPIPFADLPRRIGAARTIALVLGLMSLAGVPPLPGFWAKLALFRPAWQVLGPVPTAIGIATAVAAAVYYLNPVPDLWNSLRLPDVAGRPGLNPGVLLAGLFVAILTVVPGFLWAMSSLQ